MRKKNLIPISLLVVIILGLLLSSCSQETPLDTPVPTPTVTPFVETPEPEPESAVEGQEEPATMGLEEIVNTRAPQPTTTPDWISREVKDLVESTRLEGATFLGLTADNWINLGISLLIIVIGYAIGTFVTRGWVAKWVSGHTSSEFGEVLQEDIAPRIKWLIVIPAFYLATIRLDFISVGVKRVLGDVYFVLGLFLITLLVWSLTDVTYGYYRQKYAKEGREEQILPILLLLRRIAHIAIVLMFVYILFAHFGVNITALLAAFGIAGLALSLAAQDTLADAIAGFIILADQPYRVGDRIEIQNEGT